ncbi:hypothetical protein C4K40_4805 [Pseudomonas sp. CMR5c]|nr:hypothetical protein C4K40_4805 [Pseudomonas sp. CMR5c]
MPALNDNAASQPSRAIERRPAAPTIEQAQKNRIAAVFLWAA